MTCCFSDTYVRIEFAVGEPGRRSTQASRDVINIHELIVEFDEVGIVLLLSLQVRRSISQVLAGVSQFNSFFFFCDVNRNSHFLEHNKWHFVQTINVFMCSLEIN